MRSMTAFARESFRLNDTEYLIEIRTVNGRVLDLAPRLPFEFRDLEEPIRKMVKQVLHRGRVQLTISPAPSDSRGRDAVVNLDLARQYQQALYMLKRELNVPGEPDLSILARFRDLFTPPAAEENAEKAWECLEPPLRRALDSLNRMRQKEGDVLAQALALHLGDLADLMERIQECSSEVALSYAKRMSDRIREFTQGIEINQDRILQEAALMAERSDITEELVRVRSHIEQFKSLMAQKGPSGRKLDFLTQELHREVNTIGSKAQDARIAHWVVEAKSEVEKMREQLQNVE